MLDQINIQDIIKIAKDAGKAIMKIYNQNFDVEYKTDSSPLTIADKKSNEIIVTALNQLSVNSFLQQNIPILSEEGRSIPYDERKNWEYFWLIDPLDGTKEFVKKNGEFTINIALIYKGAPVLGVVYSPVLNVCYWAKKGESAFKDGKKLPLKAKEQRDVYKIVASRSHMSNETKDFIEAIDTDKEKVIISIGSSLKICLVAEGEANIYPRLGPTMEWDTAAAHAIVNESGGLFNKYINKDAYQKHVYNKENLLNDWFIVKSGRYR
jgi:3'(2'), 5'-bisphosphate nucleotidase